MELNVALQIEHFGLFLIGMSESSFSEFSSFNSQANSSLLHIGHWSVWWSLWTHSRWVFSPALLYRWTLQIWQTSSFGESFAWVVWFWCWIQFNKNTCKYFSKNNDSPLTSWRKLKDIGRFYLQAHFIEPAFWRGPSARFPTRIFSCKICIEKLSRALPPDVFWSLPHPRKCLDISCIWLGVGGHLGRASEADI